MGSRDRWQSTLGLSDFASSMRAMQEMMSGRIVVSLASEVIAGREGLYATAAWYDLKDGKVEQNSLVSVKIHLSTQDYASLDVALFRLLYLLDGKLAFNELPEGKTAR